MPFDHAAWLADQEARKVAKQAMRASCPWREFAEDRKCCDYCGARLPKYRRNWCDDECRQSFAYNHMWQLAKVAVWARESNACCHCGIFVLRGMNDLWHAEYPTRPTNTGDWVTDHQQWNLYHSLVTEFYATHKGELGEVDHIEECGGNYNSGCQNHTSNLRLLCRRCHRSRGQWDHDSVPMELVIPGHLAAPWDANAA